MTGFGSPCGACKFLRRKCVKGCVFAPYFCHEQDVEHFAAIHKVFGASNVSKLLMQLPVTDRSEAAITISYEAQARLQDPIYGCVAHIFALQQQVMNLQAQLASLKDPLEGPMTCSATSPTPQYNKLYCEDPPQEGDGQDLCPNWDGLNYCNNRLLESKCMQSFHGYGLDSDMIEDSSYSAIASLDMQTNTCRPEYNDMEDLLSVAYAYVHRP
ncbi:LOB domain-containing protein 29-like [Typha latifolia]|uniref:LOB domain-containing protein 29-like n=1 Tax=Typha latifolia TaxID=4733 RepID=UPI003C2B6B02